MRIAPSIIYRMQNVKWSAGGKWSRERRDTLTSYRRAMANQDHQAILRKGVEAWNQWRSDDATLRPDLRGADLYAASLSEADPPRGGPHRGEPHRGEPQRGGPQRCRHWRSENRLDNLWKYEPQQPERNRHSSSSQSVHHRRRHPLRIGRGQHPGKILAGCWHPAGLHRLPSPVSSRRPDLVLFVFHQLLQQRRRVRSAPAP